MGRCQEFGLQIRDGCDHVMVAGKNLCSCPECRTVCGGRFAGCPDVWARGPQPVTLTPNGVDSASPTEARSGDETAREPESSPAPQLRSESSDDEMATVAALRDGDTGGPESAVSARSQPAPVASVPVSSGHAAPAFPARTSSPAPHPSAMRSSGSQAPASAAALRWLEGAFAGLQSELQSLRGHLNQQQATMAELVSGITQQQALLSELLDARDSDFRLAEAAEALPQFVSDAVAHEARVNRERTVAAIESTLDAKLAEASADQGARGSHTEETVAELRAFLQNDPATGSIVAAISTQAASQAMRTEMAEQLPKVVNQALASSEARIDELAERMDKLVTKAMRAGARTAKATDEPPAPRPQKKAPKAAPSTSATKAGAARTTRTPAKTEGTPAKSTRALAATTRPAAAKSTKSVKPAKTDKTAKAAKTTKSGSKSSPAQRPAKAAAARRPPAKAAPAATRRGPTTGRTQRAKRPPARTTAPESV